MQLSRNTILGCTNPASFGRGEKYYQEGRVHDFRVSGGHVSARVAGTEEYLVELDPAVLEGECDCYAFDGKIWCKHIVAVALTLSGGKIEFEDNSKSKRKSGPPPKQGVDKTIADTDESSLRMVLSLIPDRFPETIDFIEDALSPPQLNDGKTILSHIKKSIAPVKRARSWSAQVDAAMLATEEMEQTARSVAATKESAGGLLRSARYIYEQLMQIDDSDGELQRGAGALLERALEIINDNPEWGDLLYDELAVGVGDFPLGECILADGNEQIRENFVARLEKHLYKRDPELAGMSQDWGRSLVGGYFARLGDDRVIDFLKEHETNENVRFSRMVEYHEARSDWNELVELLWPRRDRDYYLKLLQRALSETGETDRLLTLQIQETVQTNDVKRALVKLRHVLEQANQLDRLPTVIDELCASRTLPLDQKLWLMIDQKRYESAADTMISALNHDATNRSIMSPNGTIDLVIYNATRLQVVDKSTAARVWRELLIRESSRMMASSRYDRFEAIARALLALGDHESVHEVAARVVEEYPTRKKLVAICEPWLA